MRIEELEWASTRDALVSALIVHEIKPEEVEWFVRSTRAEERSLLGASSSGLLAVSHSLIAGHPLQSWRLGLIITPWCDVRSFIVTSETVRDQWEGFVTSMRVAIEAPELSEERPKASASGLAAFAARCLLELNRLNSLDGD